MSDITIDLKPGTLVKDNLTRSNGRVIKLEARVDPQGEDIPPFWQVSNTETGLKTTIREDRFAEHRWEQVS